MAVGATPNEISAITSGYYATPQTVQDSLDLSRSATDGRR